MVYARDTAGKQSCKALLDFTCPAQGCLNMQHTECCAKQAARGTPRDDKQHLCLHPARTNSTQSQAMACGSELGGFKAAWQCSDWCPVPGGTHTLHPVTTNHQLCLNTPNCSSEIPPHHQGRAVAQEHLWVTPASKEALAIATNASSPRFHCCDLG